MVSEFKIGEVRQIDHLCPVCGFEMDELPAHYNICPSCGTEFGLSDANASWAELRANWVANGLKWWSESDPIPSNWNPLVQLARLPSLAAPAAPTIQSASFEGHAPSPIPEWFNWAISAVGRP